MHRVTDLWYRQGEGEGDTVRDDAEALLEYANSLKTAHEFLMELGFDLDELIKAQGFENSIKFWKQSICYAKVMSGERHIK